MAYLVATPAHAAVATLMFRIARAAVARSNRPRRLGCRSASFEGVMSPSALSGSKILACAALRGRKNTLPLMSLDVQLSRWHPCEQQAILDTPLEQCVLSQLAARSILKTPAGIKMNIRMHSEQLASCVFSTQTRPCLRPRTPFYEGPSACNMNWLFVCVPPSSQRSLSPTAFLHSGSIRVPCDLRLETEKQCNLDPATTDDQQLKL
jgi:hypothetical protein